MREQTPMLNLVPPVLTGDEFEAQAKPCMDWPTKDDST